MPKATEQVTLWLVIITVIIALIILGLVIAKYLL